MFAVEGADRVNEVVLRVLGDCYVSVNGRVVYPTSTFLRLAVFIVLNWQGEGRQAANGAFALGARKSVTGQHRLSSDARIRRFQADHNFRVTEWDADILWLTDADGIYIDLE